MSDIIKAIEETQKRFGEIAPYNMKFEAEKGFAIQILKNNEYMMKVAQSCPSSLQQALTNVAAIGLSLNPAEKQAYLITRTVTKTVDGQKKYESRIFLEPSYMGMIKLATDSGSIEWAQALAVYKNDQFMVNGVGEKPTHTFNPFDTLENRGEFVGVYCVAKTHTGDYLVNTMNKEQVENIRDRSEAWKKNQSGPWKTDFIEQAKKTVIRQAFKTWPRSNMHRLAAAVDMSNENEGFEPILTSPAVGEYTIQTKEYFDQLITNNDSLGMAVLQKSIDESVFTNLYHSFEKGTKGKYQKIVDDLLNKGNSTLIDIRLAAVDVIESDDQYQLSELLGDLSNDAISVIKQGLSRDEILYLEEKLEPQNA